MPKSIPAFVLDRHQTFAPSTAAVSRARYFAPQNQKSPATNIIADTTKNATFKLVRSATAPISGGAAASPNKWMMKILTAKAVARTRGLVTFASAVFDGPVLKKRKKITRNIMIQAAGNGVNKIRAEKANASLTHSPTTKK